LGLILIREEIAKMKGIRGSISVEYVLLTMLIAAVIVGAVAYFGGTINQIFQSITDIVSIPK
jgi:Flp pilus assembly pilin Flp